MATFEIRPTPSEEADSIQPEAYGLGDSALLHNLRWFMDVRWVLTAFLLLFGIACDHATALIQHFDLVLPIRWPYILAGLLATSNTAFLFAAKRLRTHSNRHAMETHLWAQIVLDLIVVTLLVHNVGSTTTFVAFTYLFHVALASIVFPPARSFIVTLLAAALYSCCVALELGHQIPQHNLFHHPPISDKDVSWMSLFHSATAIFVWFFVWYLVSTLAKSVQQRDQQLHLANQELLAADEEKNRLVLRTTHDLKAPFSGIESCIQALRFQYWDDIPPPVKDLVDRIETRSRALSERIRDILTLGDLKSQTGRNTPFQPVALDQTILSIITELQDTAHTRNVTVNSTLPPLQCHTDLRQIRILFSNLISNAIVYSPSGGIVTVSASQNEHSFSVAIADQGIGIEEELLPRIFEEYYRTEAGAQFNKLSTGLGLAIVRRITQNLGYTIQVTSTVGQGTTFHITIPRTPNTASPTICENNPSTPQ